ncbi:hypothetical protein LI177_09675 [bacterium 210820-DFI.6.37]|nr:hypothetical protein [bacterium 210820-DFI.6.37]
MKKKEFICACAAASLLIGNFATASPVSAVDYSFIQKVESLQYDQEFQQELQEEKEIAKGKPDTSWFDPEDKKQEYEISTEQELFGFAKLVGTRKLDWQTNEVYTFKDITIKLTDDIKLTRAWTPIGSSEAYPFEGTFDGNGHTVSGIKIKGSTDDNQGFFGYVSGKVRNLNLSGSIETTGSNAGGIAGTLIPGAVIENCTARINVTGHDKVGGIAGESTSALVYGCGHSGNVKGNVKVGGVVGENWNGQIQQCSNEGTVTSEGKGVGTYGTGGVAGRSVAKDALIKECYNKGNVVSSNECAGGIVGYTNAEGSTVISCYNTGIISGPENAASPYGYVGGIVGSIGENGVKLQNSYNAGVVKNGKYTGGVLGNYTADFYSKLESYVSNNYYLESTSDKAVGKEKEDTGRRSYSETAAAKSEGDMRSTNMASLLGTAFRPDTDGMHGVNNGYPILDWQEDTTVDKSDLLGEMKINYKKEFKAFLDKYPYGVNRGESIIQLANPQLFFENILSNIEARQEKGE